MTVETLMDLYEITELRNGAVYKTKYIEEVWVAYGVKAPKGYMYAPKSSSYKGDTVRFKR